MARIADRLDNLEEWVPNAEVAEAIIAMRAIDDFLCKWGPKCHKAMKDEAREMLMMLRGQPISETTQKRYRGRRYGARKKKTG